MEIAGSRAEPSLPLSATKYSIPPVKRLSAGKDAIHLDTVRGGGSRPRLGRSPQVMTAM